MTALDIRNANFYRLRDTLEARMSEVYRAFVVFGPGTTREIAERSGIDLLSLSPRACELQQVGLLAVAGTKIEHRKQAGIYEAVSPDEWRSWHAQQFPGGAQLQFGALTK